MFTSATTKTKEETLTRSLVELIRQGRHAPEDQHEHVMKMVYILLKRGANACAFETYSDLNHTSLLMFAAIWNMPTVCYALIEYGADPHLVDADVGLSVLQRYGKGLVMGPLTHAQLLVASLPDDVAETHCDEMRRLRVEYIRAQNMKRRLPFLHAIHGYPKVDASTLLPASHDFSMKLPGIPRSTAQENRDFLNAAVFGNRDLSRQIVLFL